MVVLLGDTTWPQRRKGFQLLVQDLTQVLRSVGVCEHRAAVHVHAVVEAVACVP